MEVRAATAEELPLAAEWICGGREQAQSLLNAFASDNDRFDPREVFVAVEGGEILGALFAQTLPARLADFGLASGSSASVEDVLLSIGIANAERRGVRLIQIYHDPQYPERFPVDAYHRAGFHLATRIMELSRYGIMNGFEPAYPPVDSTFSKIPGFRMETEFDEIPFRETFILTLDDNLDAPEAHLGASIDEILSGYRRTSRRYLAFCNDIPVGVAVVNADGALGDIEYIGVSPEFRGSGCGSAILDEILRYFASGWASVSRVKVDERNVPAVRLYNRFGFKTYQVLNLWLLRLPQSK